ncbi:MAG TPA: UMP kinase [Candidatus Krumholzibacteria bacterium]|nr:UMP kinase [Candidatus Krumholzibacteria bacterium]
MKLKYRRILLKTSGEVLAGARGIGLDGDRIDALAGEVAGLHAHGVQIGLVLGGGNIFRGQTGSTRGIDRVTGDHMGMLATVINSLAVQDALARRAVPARVMTAIRMTQIAEPFAGRTAIEQLESGNIVIMAGGTGNPFFTTDTAGVLRAMEIGAEVLLKGTKVDGIYDSDPLKNPAAVRYERLTYDEALSRDLRVMDSTAFSLSRDNDLPIIVFDLNAAGALLRIVSGEEVGTLVGKG